MTRQQTITTYEDIDWPLLWRNARSDKSWKSKDAEEWTKKARSFADRTKDSAYSSRLIDSLNLGPSATVLDVGCGPGTLALPLARLVKSVTAIDYSAGMLDCLRQAAAEQGITNIKTVCCSWEDDWSAFGIAAHDIAIASRSLNLDNLQGALKKLDEHATRQVVIADRIAPSPFDPEAFEAVGRPFNSGPDYIYSLNILYRLGIHPRIEHVVLADLVSFASLAEAMDSYAWMFRDLDGEETRRLEAYLASKAVGQSDGQIKIRRRFPQRWAIMSWMKKHPSETLAASQFGPSDSCPNH